MIEVFPENDYNCLMKAAALFGVTVAPCSRGMVMREGGDTVGIALWTESGGEAGIYAVKAPETRGAYFDLIVRSTLNHLIKSGVETVTVAPDVFYSQFGFAECGQKMTAKTSDIKFPHHCKSGG